VAGFAAINAGCGQASQPIGPVVHAAATSVPTATSAPTPDASPTPAPTPPGFTTTDVPPVVDHGPRTGNLVALTFDADMTPSMAQRLATHQARSYANTKVLDILEHDLVPASFFITGMWAEQYPDVMRRIAANPLFDIGNHTYDHRAYTPNCYTLGTMSQAEMPAEIEHTFAIITPYGGHQTHYFRFPGLCYNAAALAAIGPTHVTVIQGDVVSGDPGATSAAPIVRAVLTRVQPGSIVVLHITEDNAQWTDEALPDILSGLKAKGLQPVTLSTLLGG